MQIYELILRYYSPVQLQSRFTPGSVLVQSWFSSCFASSHCGSGSWTKLVFGSGTRLTVQTTEDPEPSFYLLQGNRSQVCLASGFSRHDKLKESDVFSGRASFMDPTAQDQHTKGLYSQVALLSPDQEDLCPESGGPSEESDPALSMVSISVLGLRILFIKTVVFNVLFTLRLCVT
ncbi:unnamed protein product [Knipowitschia caucasica]